MLSLKSTHQVRAKPFNNHSIVELCWSWKAKRKKMVEKPPPFLNFDWENFP